VAQGFGLEEELSSKYSSKSIGLGVERASSNSRRVGVGGIIYIYIEKN
jgi:hypothetical protein